MMRLITRRLMFGNMVLVNSKTWIERYNRALAELTGRKTNLTEFHIDITGFSPEVAEELGQDDYLDPPHSHREFIILTPAQKSAPMLNGEFSFVREALKSFIINNEAAIFAVTSSDVIVGEIDDASWNLTDPKNLAKVRSVKITASSLCGGLKESEKMTSLAERFMREEDAWCDDDLINQMLTIAKNGGELVRNPVRVEDYLYKTPDYYTSLFDGVYVFGSAAQPFMVFRNAEMLTEVKGYKTFSLSDKQAVYEALTSNDLVDPVSRLGNDALYVLRRKAQYVLLWDVTKQGLMPDNQEGAGLHRFFNRNNITPSPLYREIADELRGVEHGDMPQTVSVHSEAWPYLHRSVPCPAMKIVNSLLSDYAEKDPVLTFIFQKEIFYERYKGWTEEQKEVFSLRIMEDYVSNKALFRDNEFGKIGTMQEKEPSPVEFSV